jgi:recombinational DNA repair protein RecR
MNLPLLSVFKKQQLRNINRNENNTTICSKFRYENPCSICNVLDVSVAR